VIVNKNYIYLGTKILAMRKRQLLFMTLALGLFSTINAQELSVKEKQELVGGGTHNSLIVTLFDVEKKYAEKEWKDFLRSKKAKVTSKTEIFADDAEDSNMGDNTFDVYSRIVIAGDNRLELIAGFDLGGAFLSSKMHPQKYTRAKEMLYDFAIELSKKSVDRQIKENEKILERLVKEEEVYITSVKRLEADIEAYKKKIEEAKLAIKEIQKDQGLKKGEIITQKKVITTIKKKKTVIN